jgi:hypothetical protein
VTWFMVGKAALLCLVALACGVLLIAYVRGRRNAPPPLFDYNAAGYLDLIREPPPRERYRNGLRVPEASSALRVYTLIDRGRAVPRKPARFPASAPRRRRPR